MNLSLMIPVVLATLLNAVANTVWKMYFQKSEFTYSSLASILRSNNLANESTIRVITNKTNPYMKTKKYTKRPSSIIKKLF